MSRLFLVLLLGSASAFAEVVFDGYYKIENNGKHVGFAVKRLEYDAAKKQRTMRAFVHTLDRDRKTHDIHFTTVSDFNFHPLESDYVEDFEGRKNRVQLKFDGKSYQNVFQSRDGKTAQKWPLRPDMVMSPFALYALMLNNPVKGKVYSYEAIHEDIGKPGKGQVHVIEVQQYGKYPIYRVYDEYELNPTETWLTPTFETVKEIVPGRKVSATLVKNADEAIGDIEFNRSELTKYFNEIPLGQKNVLVTTGKPLPEFKEKYSTVYKLDPKAIPLKLGVSK